ncbi:hypothetical protein M501DRAFT_940103 [Patellaria atrata CBS 101060]|uniref:Uncharacterized protein n=1 Tax=Patellaria atrata CBS 101060 TaxID=1346257 RepID=A0A9P4S5G9_9PEZI|nr:hypothetical protein M501DRAFT_940103 [Patellaria atrata CBS 101060]
MTFTSVALYTMAVLGLIGIAISVFGLPPGFKRYLQEQALKQMGENKASYMMKDTLDKVPDSDMQNVKDLKRGVGNIAGGSLNNPLGSAVGDAGDDATARFRG